MMSGTDTLNVWAYRFGASGCIIGIVDGMFLGEGGSESTLLQCALDSVSAIHQERYFVIEKTSIDRRGKIKDCRVILFLEKVTCIDV